LLKYRLITGPILIVALIGLVILDDRLDLVRLSGWWQSVFAGKDHLPKGVAFFTLGMLVLPLAAWEMARVFRANGIATRTWLLALAADVGLVLSYSIPMHLDAIDTVAIVSTGIAGVFILALLTFSAHRNVVGVVASAGAVVFTLVYLGLLLGFLLALRREHSAWWIVGVVMTTKMCDTGAYFTGRAIGRHKLIPWLSPGKTWEGLAGGILAAALTAMAFAAAANTWLADPVDHLSVTFAAFVGAIVAVVGQLGDLTMSLFKRGAGLKDSSQILPGLGGIMDVLDSPLLVAPVAYWLLQLAPAM